ncbi:type IV pilus secretin PilQ [Comamonas sp. GB3 AK4-5]|uniref:type IV pilus secretin PilQ n=1 Tax=Comamonas sp. GB3 AK4-5 TaxID=3231487 RepID=UPI00351EA1C8
MTGKHQHLAARVLRSMLAAALCWVAEAGAGGAIESVTASAQAGGDVLRIDFSEPLTAEPTGFATQTPARIALDFAHTTNGLGHSMVEVHKGQLNAVQVVEAAERTRVVLNLKSPASYRTEVQGKSLLVFLSPLAPAALTRAASHHQILAAPVLGGESLQPLSDVDFRRGSDGAGRVVVGVGRDSVGIDVREEGHSLVVEFLRTSLPEGLRRKLDVVDFGTPVQSISTTQQGDRVRMRIDISGDWEHSAYQSRQRFVLEVRQKKADPSKLHQGPGYTGERLSLNFQNIEVRALLQVIADFTNFNIVTSDTVSGALTLRLKDVPWDQALQIIMDAKGLGLKKNGSVLWIAPKDEIDARTRKDYEAAQALEKLEPLRTQGFQLNYIKAADVLKQLAANHSTQIGLPGAGGGGATSTRFLSPRGSAIAENRTNQIFVTDTGSKLAELEQLLLKLDVPVRQVMIEARIVEARDSFGQSLGVKFGAGTRGNFLGHNKWNVGSTYGDASSGALPSASPFVNLPASLSGASSVGSVAFSIFNSASTRFLSLELSAMEADGQGKIISSPRLVTADQSKALIEQGTEFPYSITAPNGATTIAFKKAVLKLEVTPQITPEGNIILDLDVNKDSRGEKTEQGIAIDTKHIQTQVLVENGGTVVIGGIFEMEETRQVHKIPLLGDMPVLGHLFKNQTRETSKREMLVFITPRMLTENGIKR